MVLCRISGYPLTDQPNSVEYRPKTSEQLLSDSNVFRDFTNTACHLLTTLRLLETSCKELRAILVANLFSWESWDQLYGFWQIMYRWNSDYTQAKCCSHRLKTCSTISQLTPSGTPSSGGEPWQSWILDQCSNIQRPPCSVASILMLNHRKM